MRYITFFLFATNFSKSGVYVVVISITTSPISLYQLLCMTSGHHIGQCRSRFLFSKLVFLMIRHTDNNASGSQTEAFLYDKALYTNPVEGRHLLKFGSRNAFITYDPRWDGRVSFLHWESLYFLECWLCPWGNEAQIHSRACVCVIRLSLSDFPSPVVLVSLCCLCFHFPMLLDSRTLERLLLVVYLCEMWVNKIWL